MDESTESVQIIHIIKLWPILDKHSYSEKFPEGPRGQIVWWFWKT